MTSILITTASTLSDLQAIKSLQEKNMKSALAPSEAQTEGFVTAEYSLEFLQLMNEASPAIVAKDGEQIAGYAIATIKSIGIQHDLLRDLFDTIETLSYQSKRLGDTNYIVVGQLCVAKGYRGMGIAKLLYEAFRKIYSTQFDYCITDVAEDNPRSLAAHIKAGFQVVNTLHYGGVSWHVVLWDWNS
ncbi:MAG: GNAT family N-acetyltransferase [Chitinophagaceae bacterium]|nr:GNAT family N-acetyltransferase [Chitinophagaceae bacterium]